jgi:hypothetical protein
MSGNAMASENQKTPDGFSFLTGSSGDRYLACRDPYAAAYAVRVLAGDAFRVARRVPSEALAVLDGADRNSVVWHLGLEPSDAAFQIVVHRPFGPLLQF